MKALKIVTHDGTFHTDDVFACATLSLAFKDQEIEITRSRDEGIIKRADIAVDVGNVFDPANGKFDHHQKGGADVRENGIPYASFGLVWREYGTMIAGSDEAALFIDEQLVQGIDGADTGAIDRVSDKGVYMYSVIDIISAVRPTWQEDNTSTEAFMEAVNIAIGVLLRAIAHTKSYTEARGMLEEAYESAADKRIIDIGTEYPGWYEVMGSHPEPLFVIYEREDGNWTAKGVRINPAEFPLRKQFPESWAGLRDRDLEEASGVPGAVFCHNGRFIAVAKTRDGALKLAQEAIKQ